ncbi:MAG TPA: peptidase M14, partial [Blastocatellia bacterium]|nr:peptidase M14 [Blastocatellia bacterium]
TVIRTRQLAGADLSKYHVIILPDGSEGGYTSTFGAEGVRRLKDWVSAGGTLVALGSGAVSFLADSRTGLLAISRESRARPGSDGREADRPAQSDPARGQEQPSRPRQSSDSRGAARLLASEEDYNRAIQAETEMPDAVAGVLAKARLDGDHWITAGLDRPVHVLVEGRSIFTPIKLDRGVNAAIYLDPDHLLASGYIWEENRRQLAYKPFVVVQQQERGVVVGFTSDPNFRAYMDGLNVLFLNAVFRGAANARPSP